MLIEVLSRIANVIKSSKLDSYIEVLEQKQDSKAKDRQIAKRLSQANSVIAYTKRKRHLKSA